MGYSSGWNRHCSEGREFGVYAFSETLLSLAPSKQNSPFRVEALDVLTTRGNSDHASTVWTEWIVPIIGLPTVLNMRVSDEN